VGTPAIIGFKTAAELIDVGSALLVPKGVVAVASLTTSPLATSLPTAPGQPRLIWRTTYSSAESARAIGHLASDLFETKLHATPGALRSGEPMRVALVRQKSVAGAAFDDQLFKALRFNGKSALENGPSFRELVVDESDPAGVTGEIAATAAALQAFRPHLVIVVVDAVKPLAEALEGARDAPHPWYVNMTALHPSILPWIGRSAERRHRFFGVTPVGSRAQNARFILHYNETSGTRVSPTDAPSESYDAFYVLAYASYALGSEGQSGSNLARAIARLTPPGKAIDVGPAQIFEAFTTLRAGERIDLNGAAGPLDFDLTTGEAPVDQSIVCPGVDSRGFASGVVESGLVFRSSDDRLVGDSSCP
jgi:branched-chain amino acid transport system substrate-binding protein